MTFEMPKREAVDGPIEVRAMRTTTDPPQEAGLEILATHNREYQVLKVSRYNAARILAELCKTLGLSCPRPQPFAADEPIEVRTMQAGAGLEILATRDGGQQVLKVSRYNAARILVAMCMVLGVPHPKPLSKMPM